MPPLYTITLIPFLDGKYVYVGLWLDGVLMQKSDLIDAKAKREQKRKARSMLRVWLAQPVTEHKDAYPIRTTT